MRITGYILILALAVGLLVGLGIYGAYKQQQVLQNYQSVSASIKKNETKSSKFGGYTPDVLYAYTVRGKAYENNQVAPLRVNGSSDWADSVTHRIQDQGSTAYYNPQDPSQSYLLPIGRFRPYGLILTGLALLGLGILPIRAGGVFSHEPVAITGGPFDWYDVVPGGSYADRALGWSIAAILWFLLGAVVLVHYYMTTPPSYEVKAAVAVALYALSGLWPACKAVSASGIASRLGAPKTQMTQKTVHLGEPVIVRIEQPFLRDTLVREVRVTLTCYRRNGLGAVRYYASSQFAVQDRALRGGEVIRGDFTFEIPQKKRHPSTRFSRLDYPRTDWLIEVSTRTARSTVTVGFPILAENPKQAAKAA
jgi:uncharacterized protein DUF3592